jgi:FkbM family methyltransferase
MRDIRQANMDAAWDIIMNEHGYTPKPGHFVLDIGAHHGYFALFCAMRGAAVVAYEPDSENFKQLEQKALISKNSEAPTIVAHEAGVWSESGQRLLWLDPENSGANSMVYPCSNTSAMVSVVSLSEVINNSPWDCVKVDVEGAEAQIFLMAETKDLRRIKFLTMELHSHILTLDQNNALMNRLRKEFPKVLDFPEIKEGLPTGRTAKAFCWGIA